jgi:DNA (cytosine-5)-methyltransferase 1
MSKPRLLDLFCCEGGMAQGYANAGFEVVGMDINPQKRYPFEFHQGDALNLAAWPSRAVAWIGFDAIHASPPCQADSITKHSHSKQHVSLVAQTRELLQKTGLPYVLENVIGAKMPGSIVLCGASFDLTATDEDGSSLVLKRHRQFESNIPLMTRPCDCAEYKRQGYKIGGVYGGGSRDRNHAENVRHGGYTPSKAVQEELMRIDWMTQHGLHQAMPPVYGEFIGRQLISYLKEVK